jgi:hypothetical protein
MTIKWKRPSGSELETRDTDEIREYAAQHGWKEVKKTKPKPKPKVEAEAEHDGDS